jgi:hypothetical protein
MQSKIVEVKLDDNNIQKYQLISDFKWDDLIFKSPSFNNKVIVAMARLYRVNIIPKDPSAYGFLVFYNINDIKIDLDRHTEIGYIFNDQVLLNYYFEKAHRENEVEIDQFRLIFKDPKLQNIYNLLLSKNLIAFAEGNLDTVTFFPLSMDMGYLSDIESKTLSVNSHFFLMELTDIDSPYDELGTPHSLALQQSKILLPPLNHRECLLVDYNDNVFIKYLEIDDLKIKIDNNVFINNENSVFYYRPETRITPKCLGSALIIIKDKVVAVKEGGQVVVPMAGFVIQSDDHIFINSLDVSYIGESNNYKFGVQVGPAMVIEEKQITKLDCPFYTGEGVPYPSTVYPLDFDCGRASRIGIGELDNKPIIIWAEGAGKLGYKKSKESCGASLLEFSSFCKSIGIKNLINLDGGGSAQIIYNGKRYLKIADREKDAITEAERPIPLAIIHK